MVLVIFELETSRTNALNTWANQMFAPLECLTFMRMRDMRKHLPICVFLKENIYAESSYFLLVYKKTMLVHYLTSSLIITMAYPKVQHNGQPHEPSFCIRPTWPITWLQLTSFVMIISWWHCNHVTREGCWMRML